jgi:hypothetical protein
MLIIGVVAIILLAINVPIWLGYGPDSSHIRGGGVAIGTLIFATGVLAVGALLALHPVLELLPPGGLPRRARWSSKVGSLFVLLFTLGVAVYFGTRP